MDAVAGRSPRVRGRPRRRESTASGKGSIPAGAGETVIWRAATDEYPVDPRGCGGDSADPRAAIPIRGRSPRVRGRRKRNVRRQRLAGSIPAGAGETASSRACCRRRWVDPRGCGGDYQQPPSASQSLGRSPRVRGRPSPDDAGPSLHGSIPAGAGETRVLRAMEEVLGVDPRGCGGDIWLFGLGAVKRGRSPRVRGRRRFGASPSRR